MRVAHTGAAAAQGNVATRFFSAQWFRAAGLRPRMAAGVRVQRTLARTQVWHVLLRADGTRSIRVNAPAWAALGRCDGRRTVAQLWQMALQAHGDAAPTQDQWLAMLARLHGAGLVSFDRAPDFGAGLSAGALSAASGPAGAAAQGARRNTLLAWRFPLGSPDALLRHLLPLLLPVLGARWLVPWALAMAAMVLTAFAHAAEVAHGLRTLMHASHAPWLLAAVGVVIKVLHELAHGLAVHRFGGRVPEWGITALMFVPVPYVDASAASAFVQPRQRMLVAAAGMMTEGVLAALALPVALGAQPGLLRDAALAVFFIGALASVAVNLNPLMRFDGYHLLCDALQLPNLATRSTLFWHERLRRIALKHAPGAATVVPAPGELPWLWLYAPAALAMRWAVSVGVVGWLGAMWAPAGAMAAAVLAWPLLGQPLWRGVRAWRQTLPGQVRQRVLVGAALAVAVLALLPLPQTLVADGVLWQPETALVRAPEAGFVQTLLVAHGDAVQAGTPVAVMASPVLLADEQQATLQLESLQTQRLQVLHDDPARAAALSHEIDAATARLEQARLKLGGLTLRAQAAGRIAIAREADWPGRYLARGALIAHVVTDAPGIVQAVVPHADAALATRHRGAATVRAAEPMAPAMKAVLDGAWSGAVRQLPAAALGSRHGGSVETDPADSKGLTAMQPMAVAQWRLDQPTGSRLGQRVRLRLDTGYAPLAWQGLRALQQQWLHHFNPAR